MDEGYCGSYNRGKEEVHSPLYANIQQTGKGDGECFMIA